MSLFENINLSHFLWKQTEMYKWSNFNVYFITMFNIMYYFDHMELKFTLIRHLLKF